MSATIRSSAALDDRSLALRALALRALLGGGRGHIGPTFSAMEILRVAFDDFLRHRPDDARWPDRDRLLLSKGHGCIALYTLLADHGYFDAELLDGFCRVDSPLGGHPERGAVPGVEASTGALGHGLPLGVGLARAARIRGTDRRVVVVTGDGELNEGSNWEAAMAAAHHGLDGLTVLVDANGLQCYGRCDDVMHLEPLPEKWRAFGWAVEEVDGHDVDALRGVMARLPLRAGRPTAVVCRTVKGRGFAFAEDDPDWHYRFRLTPDDRARLAEAVA
jgi:transketolase